MKLKFLFVCVLLLFCSAVFAQSPSTVLVVCNAANTNSVLLANNYMTARNIPLVNLLPLNLPASYTPDNVDTIVLADYTQYIATPVYAKIKTLAHIDYIVLCRNLPSKIQMSTPEPNPEYDDQSVDSCLAGNSTAMRLCPYYDISKPFSSTTYGIYLVTRLDGWTWADANALVTNSLAAKPGGLFLLNEDSDMNAQGYTGNNYAMYYAQAPLLALKATVQLSTTNAFIVPTVPMGGYISWGSNDVGFTPANFAALKFQPGAIAETYVFSSAINLRYPQPGYSNGGNYWNDSQIATLIHSGVTGVNGYVAAGYVYALLYPQFLFPHYVSGMNLAESFYSAERFLGWKGSICGDPLACPYGVAVPAAAISK